MFSVRTPCYIFTSAHINHPLAREVCLDRALPKRARRNTPALPLAESSSLPTDGFIGAAPLKEAAEKESDGSHEPESMVGIFNLLENGF